MRGPNVVCACGKAFTSVDALRQHQAAVRHQNARQRKRAARQRRMRKEAQ